MKNSFLLLTCWLFLYGDTIDTTVLPVPRNYEEAYRNHTRSSDGRPGSAYWQNTADYKINVSFNPSTIVIAGNEEIVYTNNSPDTLSEIWFKLYPNYYKKNAARDGSIEDADAGEGVRIEGMIINGKPQHVSKDNIAGTNMIIPVDGLLPGKSVTFSINWSYLLNKNSHQRTGMVDDNSAFIAYFFPRITVYDDIDGWNKVPYKGTLEMYNDFCHFDVNISVPGNYLVCATGNLMNASEVLNQKYVQRLQQAEQSDAITKIIDTTDNYENDVTAQKPINNWHFTADDVTDFVFAASNHYIWYSSSVMVDPNTQRRTRVDAVFNPEHKDFYEVISFARKTVESMSYAFPAWPYPYPHETVFDGLDQMEYPMMVNDNPLELRSNTIELTDHEIFHTMFPFYMGINETKHAWMDEGWATIGEWLISPMIDSTLEDDYGMSPYNRNAGVDKDMPVITPSTEISGYDYYLNSYPKPAMGYLYVKDMLGDELFTKALHYYIEQWHGRHPTPLDFFNCMNEGAGRNMNWFWKNWFYENGIPDLVIKSVTQKGKNISAEITMKGNKMVPVHLTLFFSDGSTVMIHKDVSCWQNGNTNTTLSFSSSKKIIKAVLGNVHDADADKSNNTFKVK